MLVEAGRGLELPQKEFSIIPFLGNNTKLIFLSTGLMLNGDSVTFDGMAIYNPIYTTIVNLDQFKREEAFLRKARGHRMFNIFSYINDKSDYAASFARYINGGKDLDEVFDIVEKDCRNGNVPFNYGIFKNFNTKHIRKWAR